MRNIEGEDHVENEEKDEQLHEWVEERPGDTKDGTLVAQLHVAAHQFTQQVTPKDQTVPREPNPGIFSKSTSTIL